ncbi:HCNGP-like protein, putative [Plasmodium ovale wallikeri]|uniref:HCNGP-like protein, putative n=1 Tax=Plasmodium ovale wallikeri TaxID=864142 RepID=A0A1A8YYY6_PLAOA|nr:HCNGP-like protein, putative [Plasmodium ovale wallikeri]SBT57260.1 HCNGP-like protein, putative [Plasmodium ovale wallikeri]
MNLVDYEISSDEELDSTIPADGKKQKDSKKGEANTIENKEMVHIEMQNSNVNNEEENMCSGNRNDGISKEKHHNRARSRWGEKEKTNLEIQMNSCDYGEKGNLEERAKGWRENKKGKIDNYNLAEEGGYIDASFNLKGKDLNMHQENNREGEMEEPSLGKRTSSNINSNISSNRSCANIRNSNTSGNNPYWHKDETRKGEKDACVVQETGGNPRGSGNFASEEGNDKSTLKENMCCNNLIDFKRKGNVEQEVSTSKNISENNNMVDVHVDENNFDDIFCLAENEYSDILNKKIDELSKLYDVNLTINKNIINSNEYKNPCILEKIMQIFHIDVYASNYPPNVYNPHDFLSIDLFNEKYNTTDPGKIKTKWSNVR